MTSRFSELVLDCHDPKIVAGFWCAMLGYKIIEESDEVVEIGPEDMPDGWTPELIAKWKERMRGAPSGRGASSISCILVTLRILRRSRSDRIRTSGSRRRRGSSTEASFTATPSEQSNSSAPASSTS